MYGFKKNFEQEISTYRVAEIGVFSIHCTLAQFIYSLSKQNQDLRATLSSQAFLQFPFYYTKKAFTVTVGFFQYDLKIPLEVHQCLI